MRMMGVNARTSQELRKNKVESGISERTAEWRIASETGEEEAKTEKKNRNCENSRQTLLQRIAE